MPIWSLGRHIPTQKIPKCPPGITVTECEFPADIRNALLKLHRYLESRTTMNGTGTCQFAWKFNSTPCWIFANKNPWIVKWRREFKRQRKRYQTKQAPHFRSTGNKYISILNHDYNLVWIAKVAHVLKKINWTHFFMLGCKTPGGFLFAMFDFIMPILEQLE